jgi:mannose-6-phosphate isomerase-like protein (cupin superfamily)
MGMPIPRRAPRITPGTAHRAPGWRSPVARADGDIASARQSPDDFPLRLVTGSLAPGASLEFDHDHGDEVLYVLAGSVDVDGRQAPAGGAVVVEAGIATRVVARTPTELLHFGPVLADARDGTTVHVVGPGGTWAQIDDYRDTRFFADSTCPTCTPTLLLTGRSGHYESPAHSHSQDELMYVLRGELQFGAERAGPGSALAIGHDVRYRFRSDEFALLNYRRGVSYQTLERDRPPVLEGGAAHGFTPVMDVR